MVSAATFANALAGVPATGALVNGRTLARGTAVFAQTEQSTAIDTNIEWRFGGSGFENTLLGSVDLLFQKVDSSFRFGAFPTIDLYAPVYGAARGPLATSQNFVRKDDLVGFYLQDQLKIGERLTILAGLRYDHSRVDTRNRIGRSRQQKDSDVTFRGGAVYQVTPGVGLYASYAEAFNPNFGLSQAGQPFDAETGKQYEAGIKTDLNGGRLRTTLAVYQLTRDDVLVPFPGFPGLNVQTGQQRSKGIEADASLVLAPGWNLTGAYSYTDVFVRRDANPLLINNRPINVPKHQGSLWASYDLALGNGSLRLGGGARAVSSREAQLPNSYRVSRYVIADAAIGYRIDRWRFQVNAYNLFDRNYIDSASPTGTRAVLVGEPLTVRASVGFSL